MNIFRFALTAILASASVGYVAAYPSGSGGCARGRAAPGLPHRLFKDITRGSLSDGGFNVTIDGQTPVGNKVTTNNLNFDVVVTADSGFFKGILIRVSNTGSDEVIPADPLTTATACGSRVGSATHNSNSEKTSGTATIDLDDSATLNLDITVVVQNDDGKSIYYYMGYKVIVESEDASCRDGLLFRQCGGGK
jgi:hypothetical protein